MQRYKQVRSNSNGTETLHYIGKTAELSIKGSTTTTRLFIDDIAIISKTQQSGQSTASYAIRYTLRDRLGSVVSLTNEANTLSEHRSFDPFGKPRKGDYRQWSPATLTGVVGTTPFTSRGFTDHEHLDGAQLIHMNGRVYDYNLGRFYSVDPVIQAPGNSQSLNPYSYIMNNPLAGTDPTGYTAECVEKCPAPTKRSEPKKRSGRSFVQDWYQYEKPNNGAAQNAKSTEPKTDAVGVGSQNEVFSKVQSDVRDIENAKFVDDFIAGHVNHITESEVYSKPNVVTIVPNEVREALIIMSSTETGRALLEHFIKTGTILDLVDTTTSRTLKNNNLSSAFSAIYGEDSKFRDTVYYTRDLEGFRSIVRKNNPSMLNNVINSITLDVGLVMELGHTRAGNKFGINAENTYIEVVPHSLVENKYRAERGLPIRRTYNNKDDIFNYMKKINLEGL